MSPPPLEASPKRHRRDAFRESLASDSLDSHPIPVVETRARRHFPKFFFIGDSALSERRDEAGAVLLACSVAARRGAAMQAATLQNPL
jgi:hypothetical protein